MKVQISLKWFVALVFLSLVILLVIGYSFLSAQYFIRGMDNIVASNMEQIARNYFESRSDPQREHYQLFSGYLVVRQWQELPQGIRQVFQQPPAISGESFKRTDGDWPQPPKNIYFLMRYEHQGDTVFITHSMSPSTVSKLVDRNATQSRNTLFLVSSLSALILIIAIWLLLRRVSQPVAALGRWTRSLDSEKLSQPPPDFAYVELNALAELIRTSLSSVQQSLEREQRFLRHASHELRTPISTIRSNIELMRKLQECDDHRLDSRQKQVFQRIDRASLTMQNLTEVLLWLSRDSVEALPEHVVSLDRLVRQLVEESRYLLNEKNVSIDLVTQACEITLPEVPARIVLGNLIRNAFQHTVKGFIVIHQQHNQVEILNEHHDEENNNSELGFGLGLQLTRQLTNRLGWFYVNEAGPQGHRAAVSFCSGNDRS